MLYPRNRSRDGRSPTFVHIHVHESNGSLVDIDDPGSYQGQYEAISDFPHPGFKRARNSGQIVMGPLDRTVSGRTAGESSLSWTRGTSGYAASYTGDLAALVEGVAPRPQLPSSLDVTTMGQIALIKAYAKMNASPIMGGEILRDLDKTVGMLRRPFQGAVQLLGRMVTAQKRHLGRASMSVTKASAKAWLEYRYGWKPFILDCNQAVKEVNRIYDDIGGSKRLVARAEERMQSEKAESFTHTRLGYDTSCYASGKVTHTLGVRACAGVIYSVNNAGSLTEKAARLTGMNAAGLPATLWEIVPYSFVVDWFVNVGEWIQAVTPNPYTTVLSNWVTTISEDTLSYSGGVIQKEGVGPTNSSIAYGTWSPSEVKSFQMVRSIDQPLTSTPVVTRKPLSPLHSVDAVALLCNQINGGLAKFRH